VPEWQGQQWRADAARCRQALARAALADLRVVGDPQAYHLWLELPETWRAEAYAASAWLMDRLKAEAPVWKREHTSGAARWVANTPPRAPVEQT
jgi:hypothetical protein